MMNSRPVGIGNAYDTLVTASLGIEGDVNGQICPPTIGSCPLIGSMTKQYCA